MIPGSGRSTGEGIGYLLQHSWASLVAQLVKNPLQCGRPGFNPWFGKISWRREKLPTPVFWPGELHGLCSPWGHKESGTTEQLSFSGFRDSSVGKESAYNPGDPSLIPGLGKPGGEGIDYSLQYSWASLVAQLAKNPPAMWETWVRSLGWKDPLEKGTAPVFWPGEFHGLYCIVHGVTESWTRLSDFHFTGKL